MCACMRICKRAKEHPQALHPLGVGSILQDKILSLSRSIELKLSTDFARLVCLFVCTGNQTDDSDNSTTCTQLFASGTEHVATT